MWAFELTVLIIVIAVVVWAIHGGKQAVFESPLVIDRPGLYITLAPQLGCAQAFIEHIAEQCGEAGSPAGDVPTQFFEVHAEAHAYLLAASWRAGVWYFQGILPGGVDRQLQHIRAFSEAVLANHPQAELADVQYAPRLRQVVEGVAQASGINVRALQ